MLTSACPPQHVRVDMPDRVRRMLRARSIVFVGGEGVTPAISYLRDLGFDGELAVVNAKRRLVAGVAAVASVDDLAFSPEVAFVAINRQAVVDVVRRLVEKGTGAIVCNSAGFAETGPEGARLQQELVTASSGAVLIGPNCNGFVNYFDRTAAMVGHMGVRNDRTGAALVSQGGGFLLDTALARRSLPLGYIMGTGNQAMLSAATCARGIIADERVTALGLYIEGSIDVAELSVLGCEAIERELPVVVLKSGRSSGGARAVRSHTASLAGEPELVDALFDRLGFIQVRSTSEMIETLKFLTTTGKPAGRRVGIISSSGVESALAADSADAAGLSLPPLEEEVAGRLRTVLPPIATVNNPLDLTTTFWGDHEKQAECCVRFMQAPHDVVIAVETYPPDGTRVKEEWDVSVASFVEALERTGTMGAIISSLPENLPANVREQVAAKGVTPLQGMRDGMVAVANAASYRPRRTAILRDGPHAILLDAPPPMRQGVARSHDEAVAKDLLARAGLAIPRGLVVSPGEETARPAFPGPYVVKLLAAEVTHKTELGGVRLGIAADRIEEAIADIAGRVRRASPSIPVRQFLVEEMITDGVCELLVGIRRDPQLGLALVLGHGGIGVELYGDRRILLLPTTRNAVADALSSLRCAPLLQGFRGRPAGDVEAAVDAVLKLAAFAAGRADRIVECEVNPLIVRPAGLGAVAVDALLVEIT